jgi:hydrogenase maturation protease
MSAEVFFPAWVPGEKLLFYGIGNLARRDDGLGIRLIEKLENAGPRSGVSYDSNYQLNAEDALVISEYDLVIFVDATKVARGEAPFSICSAHATSEISFSTHAMSVGSILSLCQRICGRIPKAYLLTIPGYDWELKEELTARASENLERTFEFLQAWISKQVHDA